LRVLVFVPRLLRIRTALLVVALAALLPSAAVAIDLPAPPSSSGASAPPAPQPSQSAAAPAAAPATRAVTTPRVTLRIGTFGAAVRDLQRELRRRGQRYVRVDGSFGPATRRAVKVVQRRLRMRATGVASAGFLRRLGIQVSAVASAPAASAGPNAQTALGARYLRAFPVLGTYTYQDDFGAARHQGAHEGNDIMAARGTLTVAVADGVIKRMTRTETGLGGIWIWLQDGAGNEYYYAHLDSIAEGLRPGSRVTVGQVIGTVGNTGDARYGAPHLHFEVHPGGGGAVNPYSDLVALDPKKA
jgi:murein DD-endopeptidase MepM/ murein hydrolase activator NlpD